MERQEQGVQSYTTRNGEKRYRVRWREGGKHRSRSFRRLSGEHGARRFYRRMRESQEAGVRMAELHGADLTLASFVDEVWAPRARRRLAMKTWERDCAVYRKHIVGELGGLPIARIGFPLGSPVGQTSAPANGVGPRGCRESSLRAAHRLTTRCSRQRAHGAARRSVGGTHGDDGLPAWGGACPSLG